LLQRTGRLQRKFTGWLQRGWNNTWQPLRTIACGNNLHTPRLQPRRLPAAGAAATSLSGVAVRLQLKLAQLA